ncbi:MAG: hypothetical protein KAX38_01580 [Candidatus Krumholzibacteria bacterium]|nr:hypothetical protein [Candidatus Krumholzibacteria bacterium]
MKRIILFIIVGSFLCLNPAGPSIAGVTVVGSLSHDMTVKPGERIEGMIMVKNNDEEYAQVSIFQTDYLFNANGETQYGEPGSNTRSNTAWMSVSPTRLTIPPKETVPVYYEINVPKGPDLKGTYWSVLMVEPTAPIASDPKEQDGKITMGVRTVMRYAIQIVTNIGETGNSTIKLSDNKLIKRNGKTILQTDIENTGETFLRPFLWMELYNEEGAYMGRFESDRLRIFPACSVRHNLDLTDVPSGLYTALFIIDNGDDRVFGANYEVRLK